MASALILLISLLLLSSSMAAISAQGFTVELIHRDSPKSPSYDPSSTHFQRLRSAIDRSFSRKSSLLQYSMESPITPSHGDFLMEFMIGTPPVKQFVLADTGSDLLWTQCKPCTRCFNQTVTLLNPSASSSYRAVPCASTQCDAASRRASCDDSDDCLYQITYGDGSHSGGNLAVETLTFIGAISFPNVAFGCGRHNEETFSAVGTGIIGLGGGSISIINQLHSSIGGKFSYCLTMKNASSKMRFGSNAVVAGPNAVYTPLVRKSHDQTYYYLTLEGISVGTERVVDEYYSHFDDTVEEGNIIIDSGTTLSFVPAEIYEGLESSLVKAVDLKRVPDPRGQFVLCYEVGSGQVLMMPTITAHFKGADLVLPEKTTFLEIAEGIHCLTVMESTDLGIFGNLHQINYEVGYDLVAQQLTFLPTNCSGDDIYYSSPGVPLLPSLFSLLSSFLIYLL